MDLFAAERLKGIIPFVCAAEASSFVAAGRRLHLSSSAISKSVARLEARLGVVLFERSTRQLRLTEAGQAYYASCRGLLTELAEAQAALTAQQGEPGGRLRLALPATFGRQVAMPVLQAVFHQYRELRPQLLLADRFVDLLEEGIDLAIRIGGPTAVAPGIACRTLGHERLIFCAAPEYLQAAGMPRGREQLLQHDCISYGHPDGRAPAWLLATADGGIVRQPVSPRVLLSDAEAQLACVRAGLGIGQLATWLVAADLRAGRLLPVLPELSVAGLPLQLLWPLTRQLRPKISRLIQALQQGLEIDPLIAAGELSDRSATA